MLGKRVVARRVSAEGDERQWREPVPSWQKRQVRFSAGRQFESSHVLNKKRSGMAVACRRAFATQNRKPARGLQGRFLKI